MTIDPMIMNIITTFIIPPLGIALVLLGGYHSVLNILLLVKGKRVSGKVIAVDVKRVSHRVSRRGTFVGNYRGYSTHYYYKPTVEYESNAGTEIYKPIQGIRHGYQVDDMVDLVILPGNNKKVKIKDYRYLAKPFYTFTFGFFLLIIVCFGKGFIKTDEGITNGIEVLNPSHNGIEILEPSHNQIEIIDPSKQ